MPATQTMQSARAEAVRERVVAAASAVLAAGEPLTFARVAAASCVPERTLYRYYPTRPALLAAVFAWTNAQIGYEGPFPTDEAGLAAHVQRVFPGFDTVAPAIREFLVDPDSLPVRLDDNEERKRAVRAAVRDAAPDLDRRSTTRVAAALQLLTTAAAWQTLRDYWGMDGVEAAATATLAIELLLDGARQRTKETRSAKR
jgi:AcrR family transcriptional regulator